MLQLLNNQLTDKNELINSANHIITVSTDVSDIDLFGILTFSDGSEKALQFVEKQSKYVYTARLNISEEDLPLLASVKLKLVSISNGLKKNSNTIKLNLDLNGIKQTIKVSASKQISSLKQEVAELNKRINNLISGRALQNINIINTEYIKKGMIPVADDKGNFIASYPFINFITEINDIQAENGAIILDASMIKYNQDKSIYLVTQEIINALDALQTSVNTLAEQQKDLNNRLNDVVLELEANKNSSII